MYYKYLSKFNTFYFKGGIISNKDIIGIKYYIDNGIIIKNYAGLTFRIDERLIIVEPEEYIKFLPKGHPDIIEFRNNRINKLLC